MSDIKYLGKEYDLAFKEYHTPFWLSFWSSKPFFKNYERISGTDVGFIYAILDGEFTGYMGDGASAKVYSSIRPRMNKQWMDKEIEIFESFVEKLKQLRKESRSIGDVEDNQVKKLLEETYNLLGKIYSYSNVFYLTSQELEQNIMNKLTKKMSAEEAVKLMINLSKPIKDTSLINYSKDLIKIANKTGKVTKEKLVDLYSSDKEIKKMFDKLQEKYFCLTSINAEERTVESFFPEVCGVMEKEEEKGVKFNVPKDIEEDMYLLMSMIYFKDEISTYLIPYVFFGMKELWQRAANILGVTLSELDFLVVGDILNHVKNAKELSTKRKKATFFLHEAHGDTKIIEGDEAKKISDDLLQQSSTNNVKDVDEIKGTPGSIGNVKGPVQIISHSNEIKDFKEGNVLVTAYTAPEFVPAMKKAIAIVTDTGGITSHAAIVSRELGKPCIAGTKIATKVFKDGDLVEVDANKGIVKKIK